MGIPTFWSIWFHGASASSIPAGGALSRPLIADVGNLGVADIALMEIIEEKMGWEMPELVELTRPVGSKKRKKH